MTSEIQPDRLEPSWPAILGQLGREKFRLDVSQLSAKEFDLIHQCRAGCRRRVEKDLAMSGPIRPWIVEVCERGLRCREASQKPVPIDGALLDGLRDWSTQAPYRQPGDWVFASPVMDGKQPYWQKQC
ncbi:MAG: hypothetical protein DMG39_19525 [Acidobacteria bacterium]|nr:MAG: hypothetical protein DMG39_19525 [Acidobacteriota bacterium]